MKTVLSFLLSLLPLLVMAQPSHWRYSLAVGRTKPFTHLTTAKPIADERLTIFSRAGMSGQVALERSIRDNLSLRASIGHMRVGYGFNSLNLIRDTTGRVLARTGSGSGSSGGGLTVGTLGVTVNSRRHNRTILTAGLDGVVRVNNRAAQAGRRSGGHLSGSFSVQGRTQRYQTDYEFESLRISPVTLGVATRVGLDYRLGKRGLFSTEISYTKGFGPVMEAVSTNLRIDGDANEGRYNSRASNVAVRIGYKHSLFRVASLDPLQFTPYNKPELAPPRFLTPEQRQLTFKARSWLLEPRIGYRPRTGLNILGVGSNAGYFFANRHLVGVSVDYQHYGDGYSPLLVDKLLQVGPIFRTYAGRGRVAPYLEGGYQVGWYFGPLVQTRFVKSVPITMGFSARISESFRLNASYGVRYLRQRGRTSMAPAMPQLSLSFLPKTK